MKMHQRMLFCFRDTLEKGVCRKTNVDSRFPFEIELCAQFNSQIVVRTQKPLLVSAAFGPEQEDQKHRFSCVGFGISRDRKSANTRIPWDEEKRSRRCCCSISSFLCFGISCRPGGSWSCQEWPETTEHSAHPCRDLQPCGGGTWGHGAVVAWAVLGMAGLDAFPNLNDSTIPQQQRSPVSPGY